MVAVIRSTSTYASAANDTSVSVTLPAGWQPGDVCYVFGELRAANGSLSTSTTGWTTLISSFASGSSTSSAMALFRRVLQAGDTAGPTITCTSGRLCYIAVAVQGADNGTPEDGVTVLSNNNGASTVTAVTNSAITPNGAADLLLCGFGCGDPTTANTSITFGTPSGMTIAAQVSSTQAAATDSGLMVASQQLTSNATTSTVTSAVTTAATNNAVNGQAITLVVLPAATAAAGPVPWQFLPNVGPGAALGATPPNPRNPWDIFEPFPGELETPAGDASPTPPAGSPPDGVVYRRSPLQISRGTFGTSRTASGFVADTVNGVSSCVLLVNSAESQTSGTTVTPANSAPPNNAFDVVTIGSGATVTYDNTHAAHGTNSFSFSTSATSSAAAVAWSTSTGSPAQIWFRFYIYLAANPSANFRPFSALVGGLGIFSVQVNTSGKIRVLDANANAVSFSTGSLTSSNSVVGTPAQWVRVEGSATLSPVNGSASVQIYLNPDSQIPTESLTTIGGLNLGTPASPTFRFGVGIAVANISQFWIDDPAIATCGSIGPVGTAPATSLSQQLIKRRTTALAVWRGTPFSTTNASGAATPTGSIQPQATVPIPRRSTRRAVILFNPVETTNLLPGNQPDGVVYRRTAVRAVWRGNAVAPIRSTAVTGSGLVKRRTTARAFVFFNPVETTNLRPGNQPGGVVYRRTSFRAVWRGNAVPPIRPTSVTGGLVKRRTTARAVYPYFITRTTNLRPGNQPGGVVFRRTSARVVWRGNAVLPVRSASVTGGLIKRRVAARAFIQFNPVETVNAVPLFGPTGNQPGGLIKRRTTTRGINTGGQFGVAAFVSKLLRNNFEGGTSGTNISTGNSGGASGNAFDSVIIGSGATEQFSNAQAAHGTLSGLFQTTTANSTLIQWGPSLGTQPQIWFRAYIYLPSLPTAITRFFTANAPNIGAARFAVLTTGQVAVQNSSAATIISSSTVLPTGQWVRIEGMALGSSTVGQVEFKIYLTPDGLTPNEVVTSSANQNTLGFFSSAAFGPAAGTANQGPYNLDDIGVSNTGYLGPAFTLAQIQTDFGVVYPRPAIRTSIWRGKAVPPIRSTPVTGGLIKRRTTARAIYPFFITRTTNLRPGNQPGGVVYRRKTARAVWDGNAVPPRVGTPVTGGLVKRRTAARGVWGGQDGITARVNGPAGNQPGSGLVKRRTTARAFIAFNPVETTNSTTAPPPGSIQPRATFTPRRTAARAVVLFNPVETTNHLNGNQPGGVVFRRTAARAVILFRPVRTTNLRPGSQPGTGLVKRRSTARAVWAGNAVAPRRSAPVTGALIRRRTTAPAVIQFHPVKTTNRAVGSQPGGVVFRRTSARAVWAGTVVRTTNIIPPRGSKPGGVVFRRTTERAFIKFTPVILNVSGIPFEDLRLKLGAPRLRWVSGDVTDKWLIGAPRSSSGH